MSADALISRLDRPRPTGRGSWLCRCPAHEDKSPSMTVRECDDGRVLVHCFAGCGVSEILGAVGLEFDALFPPKPLGDRVAPMRRPFPAADVLEAVMHSALTVQQVAAAVQESGQVTPHQRVLLQTAVARVVSARDCVNG
jgi:hypothetical protein